METDEAGGLRERNKQRTRAVISEVAIELFLARGYENVSTAEIAAAAEVSKRTLFKYFPTKEDLVFHRIADHATEHADVVRARSDGRSPLEALRRSFLDGLDRRDPVTGMTDDARALDLARMIATTPALAQALRQWLARGEDALATALLDTTSIGDQLTARLMAAQITAIQRCLATHNTQLLLSGQSVERAQHDATIAAEHAFRQLETGIEAQFRPC